MEVGWHVWNLEYCDDKLFMKCVHGLLQKGYYVRDELAEQTMKGESAKILSGKRPLTRLRVMVDGTSIIKKCKKE